MYSIYKLTSPSGSCYVGLTKQPVQERWRQHVAFAFKKAKNHPLYNAIRKYGPGAFAVEKIDSAPDVEAAKASEIHHIALIPPGAKYNVSPGGEADGGIGIAIFWERLNADPAAREAYLERLSSTKKSADWSDYADLAQRALRWRKDNAKQAYRSSRRASRIAARQAPPKQEEPVRSLKDRLAWKHKRGIVTRKNAFAQWANRTDAERAELAQKISVASKADWERVSPEERARRTAIARAGIDRKKQGAAASAGLKRYWDELRADPARYAEYIEQRKATLLRTLENKKNANV